MTHDPDLPTIEPGSILLERYRAEEMLGVGGMGLVVAATHLTLGNKVAIKFLLPKYATSTEAAHRFVREAKAASKIASEHVARVLDTGTSPHLGPFIVMEYLEGGDLARHLKGPYVFSVVEAVDYVVQACEALAHAHAAGIVHRDMKPANLFLGTRPDGLPIVKVLDFGISKVAEDSGEMNMTKTTAILGSGFYMSPEQMRSSKNVDHRTDIYGLGITLYEILAKTVPYNAESFADLAIKVAVDPPDPLRRHRPDVAAELAAAIEKAYAKKPDERYQSVAELALALAPWAAVETLGTIESVQRICGAPPVRLQSIPPGRYSAPPPSAGLPSDVPIPLTQPVQSVQLSQSAQQAQSSQQVHGGGAGQPNASVHPGAPMAGGPVSFPPPPLLPSGLSAGPGGGSTGGVGLGSGPHARPGSGRPNEGSAPALAMTSGPGTSRTALVGGLAALLAVIGVGVGAGLYVRSQGGPATVVPSATAAAAPADTAVAAPSTEPTAAPSADPSASAAPSAEPSASTAPPASASAAGSASAGPVASAPARPRPPRPPTTTSAAAPPPPPPTKLCEVFNPDKGLREIVPCQ